MADFSKVPSSAKIQPKPFKAHVDEEKLRQFQELVKLSPIGPAVFENTNAGRRYGMRRDWLENAKKVWSNDFDWRKQEDKIKSYPNFAMTVTDEGITTNVHFLALFSERQDAIPIAFYHGWPGSFLEFLGILDILKSQYSPKDLPYHIIVPSLPGYAYSSGPPLDQDFSIEQAASILDKVMIGLGFESGYLAQGGDLGSYVGRHQAVKCDSCKGAHLNMVNMPPPENKDELQMDALEAKAFPRGLEFRDTGVGYSLMHGSRTGTIGLALSASPIALLSWIGEKFLAWSDEDPPLEDILRSVTLYWMTDTFPRCIYPYRSSGDNKDSPRIRGAASLALKKAPAYIEKPFGYSLFQYELIPVPRSWAATTGNLVSYSQHEQGGHFAAMERPKELLADVEDFVKKAWKS